MPDRFEIVFDKLDTALRQAPGLGDEVAEIAAFADELNEIAELRQLSAALTGSEDARSPWHDPVRASG